VRLATIACSAALALGLAVAAPARAETVAVTQLVNVPGKGAVNVRLLCPENLEVFGEAQASTQRSPSGIERTEIHFVDRQGGLPPLEDASGQEMTVRNTQPEATDVAVVMLCAKRESPPVIATANINPLGSAVLFGQCPSGMSPAGTATNLDETALKTNYRLWKYGSKYLDELPDGNATGAPSEIELFAGNAIQHLQTLRMVTRCVPAAGLETIVQSVATTAGGGFSMFVPIPDGYEFVGMAYYRWLDARSRSKD
jgi:hypothetical protein